MYFVEIIPFITSFLGWDKHFCITLLPFHLTYGLTVMYF